MWMLYAGEAALGFGLYLYNRLTAPKQPPPIARTRDSLDLPRTEEGTAIPIIYGRNQIKSAALVWMSDLNTKMGPDDQYITYGMYLLFAVGIPMGAGVTHGNSLAGPLLHNVWLGDKLLPSPGTLPRAGGSIEYAKQVFQPGWLGGPGRGGGLIGSYQWFGGWTDQSFTSPASPIGDAMTPTIPAAKLPGHRGIMCVSFQYAPESGSPYFSQTQGDGTGGTTSAFPLPQGFVLGENPSVNGFAFEVSSYGDIVSGVTQHIFSMSNPGFDFGGDADPVEVIYDLLTNPWARVGLDTSLIDMVSFAAASATLKAENHGISMVVYDTQDVRDVINKVLAQINGALYWEPTTNKYVLRLIRNDYVIGSLPVFDESNLIEVSDYTFGSWRDSVNEVRVRFTNRNAATVNAAGLYNVQTVVAGDLGNAVGNANRRRPKQIDYLGVSNPTLANKLAARDLAALSTPLGKITFVANRDAWTIRPGAPFVVNYAEYGLAGVVFRATTVDIGKLDKNEVHITAVQDAFSTAYVGSSSGVTNPILSPTALAIRSVIEAPRFLIQEAFHGNIINDPMTTRLIAMPVALGNDDGYYVNSQQSVNPASDLFGFLLQDIPFQPFPTRVQVATTYSRALEPYDTTTGLVVNNLVGETAATFKSRLGIIFGHNYIQDHGKNLMAIVRSTGEHELVAFESVTDLGGGTYRLNNVWRGLLDTAPLDHSVGEYCFLLAPNMVGRRAWSATKPISAQVVPTFSSQVGTGSDPIEQIPNVGAIAEPWGLTGDIQVGYVARAFRPLPVADFAVIGDGCVGTLGVPAIASHFKSISFLDEDVYLYGTKRELYAGTIVRGDAVDQTLDAFSGFDWVVNFAPTGYWRPLWAAAHAPTMTSHSSGGSTSQTINAHYLVGAGTLFDWYGSIDISMSTRANLLTSSPAVGKGGLAFGQLLTSYTDPRVTAVAPGWRNLLGNVRFDNTNFFVSAPFQWSLSAGATPTIGNSSAFSMSLASTGLDSHYLVPGGASLDLQQFTSVASYAPRGLTAIATAYMRNANSDSNDTGHLDLADTGTGSTAGTVTAPATTHWTRVQTSMTVTAMSTLQLVGAHLVSTEVAVGGTTNADTCWTEVALRVGRFQANVLTNFSFDTGTFAGWTNITNSMIVGSAIASASGIYAQGGAFSTSTIRQEFALPSGWEVGATAFLTIWRAQTLAGDSGTVTISAIDGGGSTLASATTGAENLSTLNVWVRRVLQCDVPDGTAKIRVDLTAVRTLGAGNSGACFDDVDLWVAKDAGPRTRINLDFGVPTTQPMPRNVAEFQLAYPTMPTPDFVFGGTHMNEEELIWTDAVVHPIGVCTGQFGAVEVLSSYFQDKVVNYGVSSVDSYQFVRGSGATAPHVAAQHVGYAIGGYGLTTPFSVAIYYKIDELNAFAGACGLIGRMDLAQGWGLELDASGHLTALLRGAGGTQLTTSLARNSADGAMHMGVLVWDGAGNLTVYDELGSATVFSGTLGEILGTSSVAHLRLGRDADDRDVMPGQIARAYIWGRALSSPQVASLWTYAQDPNARLTTYTRSAAAWVVGAPNAAGDEVLFAASSTQVAMPWSSSLTYDDTDFTLDARGGAGGHLDEDTRGTPPFVQTYRRTGHGLALGRAVANRAPSWKLNDANFVNETGIGTYGVLDNTGRYAGIGLLAVSTTQGFIIQNVAVGAVARNVTLSFWARGQGPDTFKVQLRTSAGVLVTTSAAFTLTTGVWKRFNVVLAFSGATATCQWRIIGNVGSLNFDLSSVIYSGEQSAANANLPLLIPGPASAIGDTTAQIATTLPVQFNSEGEIVVTCSTTTDPNAASPAAGTLVRVKNGANTKNQRELQQLNAGPAVRLAHTDGAAATVNSDSLLISDWGRVNKFRGRWDRLGLLDANGSLFAQSCAGDQTTGAVTAGNYGAGGRAVTWTNDTTPSTQIDIGTGTAAPEHLLVTFVGVQAREEKLP